MRVILRENNSMKKRQFLLFTLLSFAAAPLWSQQAAGPVVSIHTEQLPQVAPVNSGRETAGPVVGVINLNVERIIKIQRLMRSSAPSWLK